jgi:hypothetical protein
MSTITKYEYLNEIRDRYNKASKSEKKIILDEFCNVCDYNRKYAIRLFNKKNTAPVAHNLSKRGRKKTYDHPLFLEVLTDIWVKTNLPCSKRLKASLPLWLPHYEMRSLSDDIRRQLLHMSAATIDRIMAPSRAKYQKKGLTTTKPGSLLKKQIPIKTDQWDETVPGFIEVDTVAHCGSSVDGMFVYTINCVDIATQWTEQRAIWGKGEKGVLDAIINMENHLPFPVNGFDCDNGSEFLNWHLYRYFTDRKQPIQFTRSRPYKKNDNAHVEEKNWTHIRQYLGYQRFDNPQLAQQLNDLYQNQWNNYFNFFIPSVKLVQKYRAGSKIIKKHDPPKTPFQRIMESTYIPIQTKQQLQLQFRQLNPFELSQQMTRKIKSIIKHVKKYN